MIDPVASVRPERLSFGQVNRGTSSRPEVVTVTSAGGTALSIDGIGITGSDRGGFSETTTCPASLTPRDTCTIAVTFMPAARSARSATLTITGNALNGPQRISLSGSGGQRRRTGRAAAPGTHATRGGARERAQWTGWARARA